MKIITIVFIFISQIVFAQENHINPYKDTLELARYPLTPTIVLDEIADSTIKYFHDEKSQNIIISLILNPNSSDKSLLKIAEFLIKQTKVDKDELLTLVCHKNISINSINIISKLVKDITDLESVYEFCKITLNNK